MTGESSYFRKRFFGGFNREDVVEYISKVAKERNELATELEKANKDMQALRDEIQATADENATLKRESVRVAQEAQIAADRYKAETLDSIKSAIESLEVSLDDLRHKVGLSTTGICAELNSAITTISSMPNILEYTGNKIGSIKAELDIERATVPAAAESCIDGACDYSGYAGCMEEGASIIDDSPPLYEVTPVSSEPPAAPEAESAPEELFTPEEPVISEAPFVQEEQSAPEAPVTPHDSEYKSPSDDFFNLWATPAADNPAPDNEITDVSPDE